MDIIWSPTPNFSVGRNGRTIIAIVDHITAGSASGAIAWLSNPASQVSAHYLVDRAGAIYQLVKDEDTAWHAGAVNNPNWSLYDGTNPNHYTLGIEHEGYDGTLTETQYQSTLWLQQQLITKWKLPITTDHIIGHYRIDSVNRPNCPGPNFPWQRLFNDLKGGNTVQPSVNIRIGNTVIPGILQGDRAYVPVAALGTALGRQVKWWAEENLAVVLPQGIAAADRTGVNIAVANILIPAMLIDDHSYAPVRELAEALGHQVSWDAASNSVIIV